VDLEGLAVQEGLGALVVLEVWEGLMDQVDPMDREGQTAQLVQVVKFNRESLVNQVGLWAQVGLGDLLGLEVLLVLVDQAEKRLPVGQGNLVDQMVQGDQMALVDLMVLVDLVDQQHLVDQVNLGALVVLVVQVDQVDQVDLVVLEGLVGQ
jgi:hypothetical protein